MTDPNRDPNAPAAPSAEASTPAAPAAPAAGGDVLERNVDSLLTKADAPPRMSDAARQRIREALVADVSRAANAAPVRRRNRNVAIGAGFAAALAAAAAAYVVVLRQEPVAPATTVAGAAQQLTDGTTAELGEGATLQVLGPRRVRVTGKVLLDVMPGKGRFVVETASGTVEALGTRFVVEAAVEQTVAAVIRGSIALRGVADGGTALAELVLAAGEGGRVARGQPPTRQAVPRLSHLTSWAKSLRERSEAGALPGAPRGVLFARDPNRPGSAESPLPMKQLTVDVVVDHRVARVAIDHTFHNPADAILEGNYRFSIPPDAALQRFAMYVDGKLNEAAVVERMRARRVYEELVYVRQVDPALLEYAGVGKLQMRVYPLPPHQDKRIALAYTQTLPQLYDTWTVTVPLPKIDGPVADVRLALHLNDCANCEVASPSHQMKVARSGDDLELSYSAQGAEVGDSLLVTVRERRDQPSVARYRDGASDQSDSYLQVRVPAQLPAGDAKHARRHWVILNDVSASRGALERRAQAELVHALIGELDEEDQVSVLDFDVAVREMLPFGRVLDVDRAALARRLRGDDAGVGATDVEAAFAAALGHLDRAGATAAERAMIVYVGDGVVTSGARQLDALRARLAGKATFVGIGVGDGTDTMTLGALAGATGGLVATVDLSDDLRWRTFDLVATLNTPRVTGLTAELIDAAGKGLPGVLLRAPQLADGEEVEVVAKLPASAAQPVALELRGSLGGAPWQQRIPLDGAAASAAPSDPSVSYLPRLWAQREIDRLLLAKHEPVPLPPCAKEPCPSDAEARERRNERLRLQIVELGKRFFLLSRHTSLIVLENDAMYREYGVTKGSGQTWAPYALPETIPVIKQAPPPALIPATAELSRDSLLALAETAQTIGRGEHQSLLLHREENKTRIRGDAGGFGVGYGTIGAGKRVAQPSADLHAEKRASRKVDDDANAGPVTPVGASAGSASIDLADREADKASAGEVATKQPPLDGALADPAPPAPPATTRPAIEAERSVARADAVSVGASARGRRGPSYYPNLGGLAGLLLPPQLPGARYINGTLLDDLTELVPALSRDELTVGLAQLADARGPLEAMAAPAADPVALARLERARAALPAGSYRFGELQVVVDGARRLGFRRTLSDGLEETAGFDGKRLERRYAELGLAVTREIESDDAWAIALTYFPLWLPPAESFAQSFAVTMAGADEIALTAVGAAVPAFRLRFDGDRLRRISDGRGHVLAEVTWQGDAPVAAALAGAPRELAFTANPPGDASTAMFAAAPLHGGDELTTIELPMRSPAVRAEELAKHAAGTPAARHAAHQLLASYAALRSWRELSAATSALLTASGRSLRPGEQTLASGGLRLLPDDERAAALAGDAPVARYLQHLRRITERPVRRGPSTRYATPPPGDRGRAARAAPRPPQGAPAGLLQPPPDALPVTPVTGGALGPLTVVREALALADAGQINAALIRASALPASAQLWRVMCATTLGGRSDDPAAVAALWSSLDGELTNYGRYQAALAQLQRGGWQRNALDASATQLASLLENIDLTALPPPVDASLQYWFSQSSRGLAGWRATYARWRDRVLAGGNFDHVVALLRALPYDANDDLLRVLDRASALAGGDADHVVAVAVLAASRGQQAWAHSYLQPHVDRAAAIAEADAARAAEVAEANAAAADATPAATRKPAAPKPAPKPADAPLDPWAPPPTPAAAAIAQLPAAGADPAAASPELVRLASELAQAIGQPVQALRALRLAIAMDGSGTVSDYARLLTLSKEIAMSSPAAERAAIVEQAARWAAEWRAADGGATADTLLAQLLFATGDAAGAFRVLSSAIDRDPMSGEAWGGIAAQFEQSGRVAESLPYWHEAMILDQTNPTWRVRNARALFAVGKTDEAKAILTEVTRRRWHGRWEWTTYEARELLRQYR